MPFWFVDDEKPGRMAKRAARKSERRATAVFSFVALSIFVGLVLICTGNLWPELSRFF